MANSGPHGTGFIPKDSPMNDEASSTKDNYKNKDPADPSKVIADAKSQDGFNYVEVSKNSYDSDDVSAFIFFRMFKYKRGRQGGRKIEGTNNVGNIHEDKTDYYASIILPLMTPITQSYQINWDTFDNPINGASIGAAVGAGVQLGASLIPTISGVVTSKAKIIDAVGQGVAGVAEYASNSLSLETGRVFNQDSELVLQGTSLRKHAFEFLLTPRNTVEKLKIQEAILLFKKASHPSKTTGPTFGETTLQLSYPYEFTIFFMDGRRGRFGQPLEIPPIPDCACTNISVTYNPQSVRFHEDGSVGQYRITVQFVEHQTLTSDDIVEGGF